MGPSRVVLIGVVGVVLLAGCTGTTPSSTTTTSTPTSTTTATPTTITTTTTVAAFPTHDPATGDNLLSVSEVSAETAMKVNASQRATFENLTTGKQRAIDEALTCDCNVEQHAFTFNDKDRIRYVKYNGTWYYLRVAVV